MTTYTITVTAEQLDLIKDSLGAARFDCALNATDEEMVLIKDILPKIIELSTKTKINSLDLTK